MSLTVALLTPAIAVAADSPSGVVPGQIVIGFAPGIDAAERADVRAGAEGTLLGTVSSPREQVLRVNGDPREIAAELERRPEVAYAEPDHLMQTQWAPNDNLLATQWGLVQTSTTRAWDGARGAGALVGIVDTGVSTSHPDLGRIDTRGYDFVNADADPGDDNGHGTSVAGVIAATADNGLGTAGVAPEASIIAAKALTAGGAGASSLVARGMDHLADRGARVINLSLGSPAYSQVLVGAITRHPETLFVVAAGNAGSDNDAGSGIWPCNLEAANVICVGAGTASDTKAGFSNWGAASVDLMAPGDSVPTTSLLGGHHLMSGTSFAAPMVAGAAALLYGRRPDAKVAEVRAALESSADPVAAYAGITATGGRLNVERALERLSPGSLPAPAAAAPAAPVPVAARATPAPRTRAARRSTCTVPDLKRLTSAQARRRLLAAGCRVGTVRRQYSSAVRKGRVVTSSPRAGSSAQSVIRVSVSRGRRS